MKYLIVKSVVEYFEHDENIHRYVVRGEKAEKNREREIEKRQ